MSITPGQPEKAAGTSDPTAGASDPTAGNSDPTGRNSSQTGGNSSQTGGNSDSTGGNSSQPPDDSDDDTMNLTIVWFLGLALLALVGTFIGFSLSKTTFPDGLTTLASLIAGGLLGIVNPTRGRKQGSTQGKGRRTLPGRRPPA
jgi:hypothetical protein